MAIKRHVRDHRIGAMVSSRRDWLGTMVSASLVCAVAPARPSSDAGPLTLVIPFTPGGTTDLLGRIVAQRLSEVLGTPVVPTNRPGAGGALGAEFVARSRPDGNTLLLGSTSSLALAPLTHERLRYDPDEAFVGLGMLARAPMVLLASSSLAVRGWSELLQIGRTRDEPLRLGSPGHGTSLHLAAEMVCASAQLRTLHVPFAGSQPAIAALMGGHVEIMLDLLPAARSAVETGRVVALAASDTRGIALLPQVPTLSELQLSSLPPDPRFALVAPAGSPQARVTELRRATETAMSRPGVQATLNASGLVALVPDGAGVMQEFRRERELWSTFARQRGIGLRS